MTDFEDITADDEAWYVCWGLDKPLYNKRINESEITEKIPRFIESTLMPAFEHIKSVLNDHKKEVHIERNNNELILRGDSIGFDYVVAVRAGEKVSEEYLEFKLILSSGSETKPEIMAGKNKVALIRATAGISDIVRHFAIRYEGQNGKLC